MDNDVNKMLTEHKPCNKQKTALTAIKRTTNYKKNKIYCPIKRQFNSICPFLIVRNNTVAGRLYCKWIKTSFVSSIRNAIPYSNEIQ